MYRRCNSGVITHYCCYLVISILLSNNCLFSQLLTHLDTHLRHPLLSPHILHFTTQNTTPHSLSSSPLTLSTIHSKRNSPISNKQLHSTHIQLRIVDDPQHLLFVLHITSQPTPHMIYIIRHVKGGCRLQQLSSNHTPLLLHGIVQPVILLRANLPAHQHLLHRRLDKRHVHLRHRRSLLLQNRLLRVLAQTVVHAGMLLAQLQWRGTAKQTTRHAHTQPRTSAPSCASSSSSPTRSPLSEESESFGDSLRMNPNPLPHSECRGERDRSCWSGAADCDSPTHHPEEPKSQSPPSCDAPASVAGLKAGC